MQRHIKEIHIDGMSERNEPPEEGEYIMDEDVEMGWIMNKDSLASYHCIIDGQVVKSFRFCVKINK